MYWIVKDIHGHMLFKSASYREAYSFLFSINEDDRKECGIFLDYIIEDWS